MELDLNTIKDIHEAVEFQVDYAKSFEADLGHTIRNWIEHMEKLQTQLLRLTRPHPCPTVSNEKLSDMIEQLAAVEDFFPTLEGVSEELESMNREVQQISNALKFIRHKNKE